MSELSQEETFQKARRRWARTDPTLAGIAKAVPLSAPAIAATDSFEVLVTSIVHQQVSLAAGRTIYGRLLEAAGGTMRPDTLLKLGPERARQAGLSRGKAAYVTDLAERVVGGQLDLKALEAMSDEDAIEALTKVKGIGVWTAKMHLIFHMQRPDILPFEDLGLQLAVERAYGVSRKDTPTKMKELHPAWSPYASYASRTLWNWRHIMEGK